MLTPEQIREGTFLLFDKPKFWTSFDVVAKVRKVLMEYCKEKKLKVGHAGTLDPLATGLLILATGKFTKRIDEIQATDKTYAGTFYLGATTPSYDGETKTEEHTSTEDITDEKIIAVAKKFTGEIMQVPPVHSAIKQDGKSVYLKARAGKEVILEARKISIHRFEITKINLPKVEFLVECSKGTYIRSLANDLGKELSCGAYLFALSRTKIGAYDLKNALDVHEFLHTYKIKEEKKN